MKCSNHYYGLSIIELKQLAYQFAQKIAIDYPPSWDENAMAGKHWYYCFMERHRNLSLRTPEQTSLSRVKAFCKENVRSFFTNLIEVCSATPFDEFSIWNMDETGFSTVPSKVGKVISLKGTKRVGHITSRKRGALVTMALAVNAAGNSIPPFFLFPRKNMQTIFLENASPGSIGLANGSGWMQQAEFMKCMEHFIKRSNASNSSPALLLLDNHASHLSIEALDMATENGVTLLSFPPHCSHRLQPLDVSIYGPVKTYYKSQCTAWMRNHVGNPLEIRHIPAIVESVLDLALTPKNIKAGFQASGICPYNPDIFTDSDFVQAELSDENAVVALFETNQTEEEQRRIIVGDHAIEVAAHEIVTTSVEPSLSYVLSEVGPLQAAIRKPKSSRGRSP